jgi:dual specificity phosphatase 12
LDSDQPLDSIDTNSPSDCAHYFLDPLSWMRPELEQGKLDGRLECPKCQANVGKYAWQGMRCNCGSWVVPAVSLLRSKIDKAKNLYTVSGDVAGGGIRMPPTKTPKTSRDGNL